ncbi:MAG: HD domain-containing phosphohydrolase [Thermodesulfobacteriota bacterium]
MQAITPAAEPDTGSRERYRVDLVDLLLSISEATDLASPLLVSHHRRVSFLAAAIGRELGLADEDCRLLALAGAVHDIGGLSLRDRLESFDFEQNEPDRHAKPGYLLLALFPPLREAARLVRFHHVDWQQGDGREYRQMEVPELSHVIHLADRVAVQIRTGREILVQKEEIRQRIEADRGAMFVPDQVAAFAALSRREAFWLDLTPPAVDDFLRDRLPLGTVELSEDDLLTLATLFCRLIDFRSRFTATHSRGVAAVVSRLAWKSGQNERQVARMFMAGLLHDIGKLVVPAEILEKSQALDVEDFAVIRKHPYFSERILRATEGFRDIGRWTALHHERLDGSGYPYRLRQDEIPFPARLLAVADTFTALTEDRPYRCGVSGRSTDDIMRTMAAHGKLDPDLTDLIHEDMAAVEAIRQEAQREADLDHRRFLAACCGDRAEEEAFLRPCPVGPAKPPST